MKTTKTAAAKTTKATAKKEAVVKVSAALAPVVAKNETEVLEAAFDGVRRRPVVAINDEGKMVVCCRRTAAKNGWALEGALFTRNRSKLTVSATGKLDKKVESKPAKAKTTKKADKAVDELLK